MTDINTVNLLNQIRQMTQGAHRSSIEETGNGEPFSAIFQQAISGTNLLQNHADDLRTRFETGDNNVSIGQVMVEGQKASIAFEATLRVRNKLVQAYQDIMDMPV